MGASGVGAGPPVTAAPWAGSNVAPWHGQVNSFCPESYETVHPAWVHTASNATTLPPPSETATAGSPVDGDWKVIAPPGGNWGNSATELSSLSGYTVFPGQGGGR